jgi:hypothetical protein
MFVESAENLQPADDDPAKKNMYVADGNYIYANSGFNLTAGKNNVFVKSNPVVQDEGLRVVFGYHNGSTASSVVYYAAQLIISYVSDENGTISGRETESVLPGDNPLGSESTPNEGYEFDYWTADVDVTLEDGTTIEAGEALTPEQIEQIIIEQDITITAVHKAAIEEADAPNVPNTGIMTNEDMGQKFGIIVVDAGIVVSVISIIAGVIARIRRRRDANKF